MKIELNEDEFRYFRSALLTDIRHHTQDIEMCKAQIEYGSLDLRLFYETQLESNISIVDKLCTTLKKFEVLTKDSAIN